MGKRTTKAATEAAQALGYMSLAGWVTEQLNFGVGTRFFSTASEATSMDAATCPDSVTLLQWVRWVLGIDGNDIT